MSWLFFPGTLLPCLYLFLLQSSSFLSYSLTHRHSAAVGAQRFTGVWQMKEAEVRALAERVLDIDRLLYEQQLGLAWERPPMAPALLPFSSSPPHLQAPAMAHASVGPSSSAAAAGSMTVYSEAYSYPPSSGSERSPGDVAGKGERGKGERGKVAEKGERGKVAGKGERGKVSAKTVKKLMQLLCDEAVSFVLYSSWLLFT